MPYFALLSSEIGNVLNERVASLDDESRCVTACSVKAGNNIPKAVLAYHTWQSRMMPLLH